MAGENTNDLALFLAGKGIELDADLLEEALASAAEFGAVSLFSQQRDDGRFDLFLETRTEMKSVNTAYVIAVHGYDALREVAAFAAMLNIVLTDPEPRPQWWRVDAGDVSPN